jgi:leucyl-tRNA synthetase
MPNWAGSCWYHLAFSFWTNEKNDKAQMNTNVHKLKSTKEILDEFKKKSEKPYSDFWKEYAQPKIEKWLPVDWYLGGAEHAVLHLLYARFWNKILYDLGHLSFVEPYLRLRSVGIVLAEDGRKMSKSWGNVINPDDVVKVYGSDSVRLYEMFMGPWDQAISWDSRALVGMKRFLERAVEVSQNEKKKGEKSSPQLVLKLAKLIKQIEKAITEQKFNTAIAGCMEFVNEWRNNDYKLSEEHKKMFAQILSPFAPTTAQKIWESNSPRSDKMSGLLRSVDMNVAGWPSLEEVEVGDVQITIAIQINGKMRGTVEVSGSQSKVQKEVEQIALSDERIKKWVTGEVKKVIFEPGKILNLIV